MSPSSMLTKHNTTPKAMRTAGALETCESNKSFLSFSLISNVAMCSMTFLLCLMDDASVLLMGLFAEVSATYSAASFGCMVGVVVASCLEATVAASFVLATSAAAADALVVVMMIFL